MCCIATQACAKVTKILFYIASIEKNGNVLGQLQTEERKAEKETEAETGNGRQPLRL